MEVDDGRAGLMDLDWVTFDRMILLIGPALTLGVFMLGQANERRRDRDQVERTESAARAIERREMLIELQDAFESQAVVAYRVAGGIMDDEYDQVIMGGLRVGKLWTRLCSDDKEHLWPFVKKVMPKNLEDSFDLAPYRERLRDKKNPPDRDSILEPMRAWADEIGTATTHATLMIGHLLEER